MEAPEQALSQRFEDAPTYAVRLHRRPRGTLWYYNELVKALRGRKTPLYGEFERTVRELNALTGGT